MALTPSADVSVRSRITVGPQTPFEGGGVAVRGAVVGACFVGGWVIVGAVVVVGAIVVGAVVVVVGVVVGSGEDDKFGVGLAIAPLIP